MGQESQRPVVLPGFAGNSLTGLGTAPSVTTRMTPGLPLVAAPAPRSRAWLFATLSVLATVFGALVVYVALHPLPPIVVANVTTDAKLSTPPSEPPTIPLGSQSLWSRNPVEPTASVSPPLPEPRRPGVPRGPRVQRPPVIGGAVAPPPTRKDDVPIECVLDPNLPKCGAAKTNTSTVKGPPNADSDLPNILSQSALRAGVAPVKAAAKACGTKHGAKPGEKVRVKLSVAGPTGAVVSTQPEPPHQGTPLGNCAAAALKKASFAKFRKPVIGLVYSITM